MAIDFNGTGDYYNLGSAIASMPLTMACWFNPDNVTDSKILMSISTEAGTQRHQLVNAGAVGGDPIQAGSVGASGSGSANSTAGYSASAWSHACGVFTSATSRTAYLNGGNAGTDTTNVGTVSPNRTTIGARWLSGAITLPFGGLMAEAGIWSVELTAAEIASLAKGISPVLVRPRSLVLYCPLVRGPFDVKGNALTTGGSPTIAAHPRIYYPSP